MQKKKNLMIIGLIFILTMIVVSGCTQDDQKNSYYTNQEYGFKIIPPTGWITNEDTPDPVKFFCPDQHEYQINLAIKEPVTANETLERVVEQLIQYYSEKYFQNFILISSNERTINGFNAYELVYSEGLEPNMLQHKQVLFQKNNTIFSLTYTSLVDTYETYISVVDESIDSFVIT